MLLLLSALDCWLADEKSPELQAFSAFQSGVDCAIGRVIAGSGNPVLACRSFIICFAMRPSCRRRPILERLDLPWGNQREKKFKLALCRFGDEISKCRRNWCRWVQCGSSAVLDKRSRQIFGR